jgi:multimeric flavodoxin WrbA
MTITVIHGQQHKGSTYNISKLILDGIKNETDIVHEFFMIHDSPGFCVGCFNCILRGENQCPHFEKINSIVSAVEKSDLLIVDSPTYCLEMTAQLKSFFDHLSYMWINHRPKKEMFDKVAIVVSTAGGVGAKRTAKSIARQLFWLCVPTILKYSVNVKGASWDSVPAKLMLKIMAKCKKLSKTAARKVGKTKPGLIYKFLFKLVGKMQKGNDWNLTDKNYWKDNGWQDGKYPWKKPGTDGEKNISQGANL